MMKESYRILQKHLPEKACGTIVQWIIESECEFKVSKSRTSKLGDYRAPFGLKGHRISVNHDLNPYAFLLTTVHEFAHLKTWNEHKHRAKAHGIEWKNNFKELMIIFFEQEVFPSDIVEELMNYLKNPAASSSSDRHLIRVLKKYDQPKKDHYAIENLPIHAVFSLKNGRVFKKGERLRKRYRCEEVESGRIYLFNPIAEVQLLTKE